MKKPIIVINFKTYINGDNTLKLAKIIESVNKDIIIGVSATEIKELSRKTKLSVFAEHVDPFEPGRNTGFIIPRAVKKDGAAGTFLNHSEHKLSFDIIKKTIKHCKKIKLKTMVFASSYNEAIKIEKIKPDYIIYEPKDLVAGNISVSSVKPEVILKLKKRLKIPFLVGAGIKTKEDIISSLNLGARGVAFSSVITKSKNPILALKKLLN